MGVKPGQIYKEQHTENLYVILEIKSISLNGPRTILFLTGSGTVERCPVPGLAINDIALFENNVGWYYVL